MKNIKSSVFKTLGILFALFMLLTIPVDIFAADSYPTKPIRLIIPFSAGGGADLVGRLLAQKLSERLGKQMIVENRTGAGGVIGTEAVAKADPDGYTLLFIPASFTMQPALQKLPYDSIKAFAPISLAGKGDYGLVVNPNVPAKSVKEFIALAKKKPGQLVFGAAGAGSTAHMFTELFEMSANIDLKIVQFKGGNQQVVDVLGGHSDGILLSLPALMPHIKSGKLRALGTTGSKRSIFLPDVPTIAEDGVPGFEAFVWWGFLAPARTPAPIVDRLNKEIKEILALDEVKNLLAQEGAEPSYMDPVEFASFIEKNIAHWTGVVKKANIKLE
jgi:tripartite-type tricarboxylate transporter receptor subunit TctC